jgi:hypothetical protein
MKTTFILILSFLISSFTIAQEPLVKEIIVINPTIKIKKASIPSSDSTNTTSFESLGWMLVEKKGKYGFLDVFGNTVVPTMYDSISNFGTHSINWALVKKNDKYGFIDVFGNSVVPARYDEIYKFNEHREGYALVRKNDKYGLIDVFGNIFVPTVYDKISSIP